MVTTGTPRAHRSVHRWSGIGRPVDPRYPTNRALLWILPGILVLGTVVSFARGAGWSGAGLGGLNLALAGFLAWAWTRELAPDRALLAFPAIAVLIIVWVTWGTQELLGPATVLIAMRLVNRSTGKAAEITDTVIVTTGVALLAWFGRGPLGVSAGSALLLDGLLPANAGQSARRHHAILGMLLLAIGLAHLTMAPTIPVGVLNWAQVGVAGIAMVRALAHPPPEAVGDIDGVVLLPLRVRAAAVLGVAAAALTLFTGGNPWAFGAGWSAVIAFALDTPVRLRNSGQPTR